MNPVRWLVEEHQYEKGLKEFSPCISMAKAYSAKLRAKEGCGIYVLENQKAFPGYIKIGKAKNLESRIRSFVTHAPLEYKWNILDFFKFDKVLYPYVGLVEKGIHAELSTNLGSTEWYKVDYTEVKDLVSFYIEQARDEL